LTIFQNNRLLFKNNKIYSRKVAIYSIKDLERLSGIKAHTIRIWEQRYRLICPSRTQTNIRYYDDTDLKLLLNITILNKNGIKISKIATMTRDDIATKVSQISEINFEYDTQIDALTIAMIEMDEFKLDRVFTMSIQQLGFERTMTEILYPFLERRNLLWITGSVNPVQEHFMTYLLRQKVICAIDNLPLSTSADAKKFIIYLPEGERQELSLLFMHYLLKSRNYRVIYLGQDISFDDLKDACVIHKPDYIFSFINEPFARQTTQQYVDSISQHFCNCSCRILLTGYQVVVKQLCVPSNVTILNSFDETIQYLDSIKPALSRRASSNGSHMAD
jgi:MerR family transcriptional regulator, light-induced transcriptional regulator